ncbi:MAG: hypothetical protein J5802_07960 [Butyrivibrio sp.]|nr:hypothetical protein [Butyrivibrio sp.]
MSAVTVEKAILYIHLKDITARKPDSEDTNDEFIKTKDIKKQSKSNKVYKFSVQYNPTTISLSSSNSLSKKKGSKNDSSTLSFSLIFDDSKGVRKKMDSIMSLLSSSYTQQVIFCWSKMIFRGTVTSVSNTYNMFDPHGIPISGTVNLSISQKTKDTDADDKVYWDSAFKNYFKSHRSRKFNENNSEGAVEKAVLEIADFTERKLEKNDAAPPNAGKGAIGLRTKEGGFNNKIYRFECQFNPEQLSISGSGSSEMPTIGRKARSINTKINLSFTLILDKTDNQDSDDCSVQPEVEALTAVFRDEKKQMATFTWGDKSYQGTINSVNAEYKMFNSNCEPVRASVAISMSVYNERISGTLSDIWANEYMKDIYNTK